MSLDLQNALEHLYGLERRNDKLDLEGTRALLGALGDPQRGFRAVHVAGTNGKGSTCAVIERVLRESGHRTGLFTSPHLVDFRERIRVNGVWADENRLAARLDHIQSLPEGRDRTFFEVCTALAFDDFAARGVEWAVLEVGLGGRLDCTNVITPEVCAITSIALDHTEILGDTIEEIALEKAGIVKRGVPVVLSRLLDERARAVITRTARERGAPLESGGGAAAGPPLRSMAGEGAHEPRRTIVLEAKPWGRLDAALPLLGAHQHDNVAVALDVLARLCDRGVRIPADALRAGLERTRWPGRLERCAGEPRLWWDGAHNPDGLRALLAAWRTLMPTRAPGAIVLALSRDKEADVMARACAAAFPGTTLIATRSRNARALDAGELLRQAREAGLAAEAALDVPAAVRRALALAGDLPVLLTGSLFAVGEAMEVFGGAPGERL